MKSKANSFLVYILHITLFFFSQQNIRITTRHHFIIYFFDKHKKRPKNSTSLIAIMLFGKSHSSRTIICLHRTDLRESDDATHHRDTETSKGGKLLVKDQKDRFFFHTHTRRRRGCVRYMGKKKKKKKNSGNQCYLFFSLIYPFSVTAAMDFEVYTRFVSKVQLKQCSEEDNGNLMNVT